MYKVKANAYLVNLSTTALLLFLAPIITGLNSGRTCGVDGMCDGEIDESRFYSDRRVDRLDQDQEQRLLLFNRDSEAQNVDAERFVREREAFDRSADANVLDERTHSRHLDNKMRETERQSRNERARERFDDLLSVNRKDRSRQREDRVRDERQERRVDEGEMRERQEARRENRSERDTTVRDNERRDGDHRRVREERSEMRNERSTRNIRMSRNDERFENVRDNDRRTVVYRHRQDSMARGDRMEETNENRLERMPNDRQIRERLNNQMQTRYDREMLNTKEIFESNESFSMLWSALQVFIIVFMGIQLKQKYEKSGDWKAPTLSNLHNACIASQ